MKRAILIGIVIAAAACQNRQAEMAKHYVDTKRGIEFDYPSSWSAEELPQQNVLLLSSPVQEANWQTNIFLELRTDLDTAVTHEQRLATLADNLRREKSRFSLQSSRVFMHTSGLPAGEMVYTHLSQGVPLTERELVLWLDGGKTLFVTGSAVTALWSKYDGQMKVVFDSVRRKT